jgi:hypothetical protein
MVRPFPGAESHLRAWIAVALIPVFFILSFILAQGLYSLMGYKPENTVPFWVDLVASAATVVVFLVPCAAAVIYGARTRSAGDRRGLAPLLIGSLAGLGVLILTVVTFVSTPHL